MTKTHGRSIVAALFLATIGLATPRTAAASCSRWQNQLSDCEVLGTGCVKDTYAEEVAVDAAQYGDTPQEVCTDWVNNRWSPGDAEYGTGALDPNSWSSDHTSVVCYTDFHNSGVYDSDEIGQLMQINQNVQPEDCCAYVPRGPYRMPDTFTPVVGGDFRDKVQKPELYSQNRADLGTPPPGIPYLWSDMVRDASLKPYETYGFGATGQKWQLRPPLIPKTYYQSNPEVDHIIPQKDRKGCGCGTNSNRNALIISAGLNRSMSNQCGHPARLAILAKYTAQVALTDRQPQYYASAKEQFGGVWLDLRVRPARTIEELLRFEPEFWL